MDIQKLISLSKHTETDKDFIEMVISNRINFYCGDDHGAAVTTKNFSQLADDILYWHKYKISKSTE